MVTVNLEWRLIKLSLLNFFVDIDVQINYIAPPEFSDKDSNPGILVGTLSTITLHSFGEYLSWQQAKNQ